MFIAEKKTLTGNITVHLTFFTNAEKKDLSYLITYKACSVGGKGLNPGCAQVPLE